MRQPLSFFVVGIPMAQPRAKASHFGGFTRVYTPKGQHENWGMCVRAEAQKAFDGVKWEGPLRVNLTFYFPRPKAHYNSKGQLKPNAPKWHTQKPDRDNADKKIMDTLTNLGIWHDDKQVCAGQIRKFYAPSQHGGMTDCGCHIEIMEAD